MEWIVVCITAVVMSRVGYIFLSSVTNMDWSDSDDTKWVIWSCVVSAVTWSMIWGWIYRVTRSRSPIPWLVLGALSPLLGCFVFFPATPWALGALAEHFHYIIPFGIVTGLIIYIAVIATRGLAASSTCTSSQT